MANKFKYVWLNQDEIAHQQSRGLSLEILGFLPVSVGRNQNYLKDMLGDSSSKLLDIGKELQSFRNSGGTTKQPEQLVFMFPGLNYEVIDSEYLRKNNTTTYLDYLANYPKHLFTNISPLQSTEMKFVGKDVDTEYEAQESVAAEGSIQLAFEIFENTFGTAIRKPFYIDAIMFFGRAYNSKANTDRTKEELIQDIRPIGLLVYEEDRQDSNGQYGRPYIMSGYITDGIVLREIISISLLQGAFDITAMEDSDNYQTWKEFAGHMHLVNDNLSTSAKFVLTDNIVTEEALPVVENAEMLTTEGRTFAMHDRLYMADFGQDWTDSNADFSSPAMLTCMASSNVGHKNPQSLLAQVSHYEDKDGRSVDYWDGIAHTYWTDGADTSDGLTVKGSVYSVDWISNKRPALNLFSTELENVYFDEYHSTIPTAASAFGGGTQILSNKSFASRYATNMLGHENYLRGDVTTIGSQYIDFYQSGFNDSAISENRKNNISTGSLFLNSEYIHATLPVSGDYITTIAADNLSFLNTSPSEKERRVTIVNGENTQIIDANRVLLLNVKGRKVDNDWSYGTVSTTTNTIIANGCNHVSDVDKGLVFGDNNYMFGTNSSLKSRHCQIFGTDNTINSINTKKGQAQKVTLLGHGLTYDPLQQIYERAKDPCKTIVLGENNNRYAQLYNGKNKVYSTKGISYTNTNIYPNSVKQLVVGGWKPAKVHHNIQKYNAAELSVDNTNINDVAFTLMDIKGRSVDYTSRGLSIGVQENHSQNSYDYYNYSSLGSINWAKLIQLLNRLSYDVATGVVYYDSGRGNLNDPSNFSNYFDDLDGSTYFYDLVRNDNCISPLPRNF